MEEGGEGRWIEAFEELGRQHQDGMGWDGTDPPQKTEKYFSVRFKRRASASVRCGLNPTRVTIETVSWINRDLFMKRHISLQITLSSCFVSIYITFGRDLLLKLLENYIIQCR